MICSMRHSLHTQSKKRRYRNRIIIINRYSSKNYNSIQKD
uniref:Uncharacterized protein n=1 Tax=Amphimedon queenslandica TaxID=400682 RepID=A0A1X7SET0_AMPQE